ncbi:MAG: sigma-70 family RNA polymerase sigma factor [Elusimicrobia bacterium]|nr:sigma-70 family RNA polymerase sigma factor [Elusimicrobiota bacterium]
MDSEEELCRRLKAGDPQAFKELVREYETPIYSFLCHRLRERAAAEDAFAEVFVRVWRGIGSYRPQGRLKAWLFTIAHRLSLDLAEKASRREQSLDAEDAQGRPLSETVAGPEPGPEREAIGQETRVRIEAALASLPEEQRQVFLLREYGDLSFAEIALAMDCPLSTALSRMRYAVRRLRGELEGLDA